MEEKLFRIIVTEVFEKLNNQDQILNKIFSKLSPQLAHKNIHIIST